MLCFKPYSNTARRKLKIFQHTSCKNLKDISVNYSNISKLFKSLKAHSIFCYFSTVFLLRMKPPIITGGSLWQKHKNRSSNSCDGGYENQEY